LIIYLLTIPEMIKNYLKSGPIGSNEINSLIKSLEEDTSAGGHSFFLGQVRADTVNGRKVEAIEYSAYEEMVKIEAEKIKTEIISEFGDVKNVDIIHSTGLVKAGGISLLIVVSAGHRHQATAACTKAVELVKERLPVWKKEIFDDDTYKWK
jgi:Molybdopterin converting factor, large subunit